MDGVINIYKPIGITSFDVVRAVRKIAKTKKVGHTGTLDPLACGVLPICIGKGTKIVDYIMKGNKVYKAKMKLGVLTDTYDKEGKTLEINEVNVSENDIKSIINSFIGEIPQVPPMYSAIKVQGKKLYELARKGIEIERQARNITIYYIDILKIKLPYVEFEVKCSKGTYIRSLCYDIGEKLGCGASMWELERVQSGSFTKGNSILLEELSESNFSQSLIPIEEALINYSKIKVDDKCKRLLINGVQVKDKSLLAGIEKNSLYRIYSENEEFLGLGKRSDYGLKMEKLLI
ncbi:tRNA pseudouridine(55) synthase TruB [Clostridium sp. MB40-C1]|uniref:tRNA pseudouridine(55) synthase TruB n=1 Tax=Clostridium sp. MB40-C1 TaxID=3070996 RepID=UPI0027E0F19B|nr:tRNA pseudouridine(55) synthase TruB [Clostridium sp. MB40-C1]WMJ82020.1 tRNA pseudouridine(55) synthase TruB [Clostridium sp. MB40-C1]